MSNYSVRNFSIQLGKYLHFIGFATFSLENEKVHVTVYDFACLSFNISIGFLVFYLSLSYGVERFSKDSVLLALGVLITMMGGSLVSIVSMILIFHHREAIWETVLILDQVTAKFKKIHVHTDYYKRYVLLFVIFAIVSFVLIALGLAVMGIKLGYDQKLGVLVIFGYLTASFSASLGWSSMFHLAIYLRINTINITIR